MKKITKKRHLEMTIESVPQHPNPKVEYEQYSTPAVIAADVLWNGFNLGDIYNMNILDLGCGTAIFTIGSLLLGAKHSMGVDIDDESLDLAHSTAETLNLDNYKFLNKDLYSFLKNSDGNLDTIAINEFFGDVDTVIQNPPFGSQFKGDKGSDRIFIQVAMAVAPVVYSFHMRETENFLMDYFSSFGGKITDKWYYSFPIPKIYDFHTKESKNIDVVVLRVENTNFIK
jgi:putative methylase